MIYTKYNLMNKPALLNEIKVYQSMMSDLIALYIELQEVFLDMKGGRVEDIDIYEKRLKADIKEMNKTNIEVISKKDIDLYPLNIKDMPKKELKKRLYKTHIRLMEFGLMFEELYIKHYGTSPWEIDDSFFFQGRIQNGLLSIQREDM